MISNDDKIESILLLYIVLCFCYILKCDLKKSRVQIKELISVSKAGI